jgi:putative spermidine/putrescine transport system ATP-binding protein
LLPAGAVRLWQDIHTAQIAGHESATSGDIVVGPKNVTDLPAACMACFVVLCLKFPHLSVIDNVAFALRKGVAKVERHAQAKTAGAR